MKTEKNDENKKQAKKAKNDENWVNIYYLLTMHAGEQLLSVSFRTYRKC